MNCANAPRLKDLRVIFIGVNVPTSARHLEALIENCTVVAVFESVWLPKREWHRAAYRLWLLASRSLLKRISDRWRVPYKILFSNNKDKLADLLREHDPDVVCIVFMSHLLPRDCLAVPRYGILNLHPSLLPSYRGSDPDFWQIYDEVKEGGLSVHIVDEYEDHGPIVTQRRYELPRGTTYDAQQNLIAEHGPSALLEALELLVRHGKEAFSPQPEESPTHRARTIPRREAGKMIDWEQWSIDRIWHLTRGANPMLGLLPVHWTDFGFCPRATKLVSTRLPGDPGTLQYGQDGWYIAHWEGHIRLNYVFSPIEWIKRLIGPQLPQPKRPISSNAKDKRSVQSAK